MDLLEEWKWTKGMICKKIRLVIFTVSIACMCSCSGDLFEQEHTEFDPVDSFKLFSEQSVKSLQLLFKDQHFILSEGNPDAKATNKLNGIVRSSQGVDGDFSNFNSETYLQKLVHIQISNDYTIDVEKTPSLIVPYKGTLTIKRLIVSERFLTIEPEYLRPIIEKALLARPPKWETFSLTYGFQNGKWQESTSMSQKIQGTMTKAKPGEFQKRKDSQEKLEQMESVKTATEFQKIKDAQEKAYQNKKIAQEKADLKEKIAQMEAAALEKVEFRAEKALRAIKRYVLRKDKKLAKEKLLDIVKKYPKTNAAKEAQKLADKIQ